MTPEFIYKELAEMFVIPCNYSPMDEIMFESEKCADDCGKIPDSECWKRYFEVKMQMDGDTE